MNPSETASNPIVRDFFVHLTGSTQMDEEISARVEQGEDLVSLQVAYHRVGHQQAMIIRSLNGYTVRHVSGLDGWGIISKGHPTLEAAIEAGSQWVNVAPNLRSLIIQATLHAGQSESQV